MAALLVAMAVIAIVLSTTLPVFSTLAKRERETELIFRGQQYARAVTLFQRKYGNALPPNLDVLLNERFLRKQFKDPITNADFQLIGPGSPELALAATAAPVQAGRGGGQQGGGSPIVQQQQQQSQMSARGVQSNPITQGQAPGGRGGQPLGAGPTRGDGRGRRGEPAGQPFPRGGPGPARNPGGFGGPGMGQPVRP